jgi:hypothetical protein
VHIGKRRPDVTTDLDAVAVWQAHVKNGDVRSGRRNARERLGSASCLTHYLEVVLETQQIVETTTDQLVIVEQEHFDARGRNRIGGVHESFSTLGIFPHSSPAAEPDPGQSFTQMV